MPAQLRSSYSWWERFLRRRDPIHQTDVLAVKALAEASNELGFSTPTHGVIGIKVSGELHKRQEVTLRLAREGDHHHLRWYVSEHGGAEITHGQGHALIVELIDRWFRSPALNIVNGWLVDIPNSRFLDRSLNYCSRVEDAPWESKWREATYEAAASPQHKHKELLLLFGNKVPIEIEWDFTRADKPDFDRGLGAYARSALVELETRTDHRRSEFSATDIAEMTRGIAREIDSAWSVAIGR